ncbi:hypothetical protein BDB00DRAFT_828913 [Zychaea mexicana]|uniref:uncharacterized protein n=1 Tax=Zychaea mexicana TaxID=64656 RepID=UPI0022FE6AE0|nr:uncharacterized protein BDB00DRAFT_828913 [Zychaea mexicana]KAI9492413.1 hypothetical protein BDB00DRAFT_828913 [Zychaea mexicana]
MNAGIIALDLSFPDSVQFFAARPSSKQHSKENDSLLSLAKTTHPRRQKLRGKLRIVASQPTKVSQVEIKFLGQTELAWRDPLKSQHSILAERMSARKTFRKSKSILLEEATLPGGVTELGFEITIPGYLYPTFKSKFVNINYTVVAKVIPSNSKLHKKPIRAEKDVKLEKTLMPQDVASGQVAGYVVPRITMRGSAQRDEYHFLWEFKVPKWVSLDQGLIEFDGVVQLLKSADNYDNEKAQSSSRITGIAKIEVDVVQQSFYHYEIRYILLRPMNNVTWMECSYRSLFDSEENAAIVLLTESPMAFSDRLTKRHLTITHCKPSTYLHPPLNTPIAFSFPIQNNASTGETAGGRDKKEEYISHRIKSLPYARNRSIPKESIPSSSCVVDTAQYYAPSTTISKDSLACSLDSPFLEIRHYIRMIIHPATHLYNGDSTPICIGLPIHVTQNVSVTETEEDALPSYQSIVRGAEELPDYDTSMIHEEQQQQQEVTAISIAPEWQQQQQRRRPNTISSCNHHRQRSAASTVCLSDEVDLVDLYRQSTRQSSSTSARTSQEESSTPMSRSSTTATMQSDVMFSNSWPSRMQEQHVLIQERRMEDFWII